MHFNSKSKQLFEEHLNFFDDFCHFISIRILIYIKIKYTPAANSGSMGVQRAKPFVPRRAPYI